LLWKTVQLFSIQYSFIYSLQFPLKWESTCLEKMLGPSKLDEGALFTFKATLIRTWKVVICLSAIGFSCNRIRTRKWPIPQCKRMETQRVASQKFTCLVMLMNIKMYGV